MHVLTSCPAVVKERRETGLSTTLNLYMLSGLDRSESFYNLVNGLDAKGGQIDKRAYLLRGEAMGIVIAAWLAAW